MQAPVVGYRASGGCERGGARRRRARRRLPIALVAALATVAACVTPTPGEGEPVPALTVNATGPNPTTGAVTVSAVAEHFAPEAVRFVITGQGMSADVPGPPFAATFDVAHLPVGSYQVLAAAQDDTYGVVGLGGFTIGGPNVVVVYLDDLDELVTPYWDALAQTQALAADGGTTFTHAFANNPACCPSRALTLTGRYPHNTGVEANSPPVGGFQAFVGGAENDTVATRLQARGYATAFLGKYLNHYEEFFDHVPPGWTKWFGFGPGFYGGYGYQVNHDGVVESYGFTADDYQTTVLTERSVAFVEQAVADDDPFLLFVSSSAPHVPLPPGPDHADHPWVDAELPTRPNFDEADVSDKPTWLREGIPPMPPWLLESMTQDHRHRMGSLLAVDDLVAELVATLERLDVLDDTVIVLTSDNGYHLGAHRLPGKQSPYEESVRIPLVISGPGVAAGERDELVSLVDLTPTILELAGLPAHDLDGRSLVPLLAGDAAPWPDDVLLSHRGSIFGFQHHTYDHVVSRIAQHGTVYGVPSYRAVRTTTHLYVEWYGGTHHEYELYDLVADPYQLDNLLAAPGGPAEHAALVATLHARLDELTACAGPTCRA